MTTPINDLHAAPKLSSAPAPGEKERVVLAYSGGLDTSVCIKWLQEEYNLDVIAVVGDLGQEHDGLANVKAKALATGAIGCQVVDMRETFADQYLTCALAANALYENKYPLVSALSRPLIAKHLVAVAHAYGAKYIAHGCTGKGNDQVRFESSVLMLDPSLQILSPVREWDLGCRSDEIAWAAAHDVPVKATAEAPYSIDDNLWGRAIECGVLEFFNDTATTEIYTFKNITITDPDAFGRALSLRDGYKSLKLEDAVITTTGTGNTQVLTVGGNTPQTTSIDIVASTLAATGAGYGIITFNPVDITIADSDVSGYAALYMKGPDSSAGSSNSTVTVSDGSKLSSHGFVGPDDAFGTIVFQDSHNIKVNVTNSTVTADGSNGASQAVVKSTPYTSTDTPAQNNEVTFDEGSNVNATGTNSALVASNGQKNVVHAEDGTYHLDGATVVDGDGQPAPSDNLVVTGGHWNRSVADYVPAGYREQRRGGDTSDTPYAIGTTTEQPATPDEPDKPGTTPGETDNPDSPSTPDGSGAAGDPDDAATHQGGDNTDTDAEGEGAGDGGTEDGQHASGTPAASGSAAHATGNSTPSYRSTSSGQANRYAAIPQTGDTNPLSTLALGIAAASLLAMGAVTIRRHRTAGER